MPDVKRVHEADGYWVARMRYDHEFSADADVETQEAWDVCQGATANLRGGRVETITIPSAPLRGEEQVRELAQTITRELEA